MISTFNKTHVEEICNSKYNMKTTPSQKAPTVTYIWIKSLLRQPSGNGKHNKTHRKSTQCLFYWRVAASRVETCWNNASWKLDFYNQTATIRNVRKDHFLLVLYKDDNGEHIIQSMNSGISESLPLEMKTIVVYTGRKLNPYIKGATKL